MVEGHYSGSPLEAVDKAKQVLVKGAARVMGGGFAGSIICLVPNEEVETFLNHMNKHYKNIVEVSIPSFGAHEVK